MEMDNSAVREFIRREVPDWDDEVVSTARFKAFSGQRSDWEAKYHFWKYLIIKVARHFDLVIVKPSEVRNTWFNRGGLTPLCLDHVLFEMYNEGDIVRSVDLVDPTSGRLSQFFRKVKHLMLKSTAPEIVFEENIIFLTLLKDKAVEVVKLLSESHWTTSCVITMRRFQGICGGPKEASAVLSYLSGCGKVQYLSIHKTEFIEGVKVSLSAAAAVSSVTSLDCDVLHLIWTREKLEKQVNVMDQHCEMSRQSALACLKLNSSNKRVALRHARELKLASESREKCISLLNRVEEVLNVIANAESTKTVAEAMEISARAMKENRITLEQVETCLHEIHESTDSQKQVENALLESTPLYTGVEDDEEDIEEEFKKLELEVSSENRREEVVVSETEAESLCDALSSLKIAAHDVPKRDKVSKDVKLEAA